MISVTFYKFSDGSPKGFKVSGHSGAGTVGNDIICAAVSSAAYLTANTVLEVLGIEADAQVDEGLMKLTIPQASATKAADTLKGFELHIKALCDEYPTNLKITEV